MTTHSSGRKPNIVLLAVDSLRADPDYVELIKDMNVVKKQIIQIKSNFRGNALKVFRLPEMRVGAVRPNGSGRADVAAPADRPRNPRHLIVQSDGTVVERA